MKADPWTRLGSSLRDRIGSNLRNGKQDNKSHKTIRIRNGRSIRWGTHFVIGVVWGSFFPALLFMTFASGAHPGRLINGWTKDKSTPSLPTYCSNQFTSRAKNDSWRHGIAPSDGDGHVDRSVLLTAHVIFSLMSADAYAFAWPLTVLFFVLVSLHLLSTLSVWSWDIILVLLRWWSPPLLTAMANVQRYHGVD